MSRHYRNMEWVSYLMLALAFAFIMFVMLRVLMEAWR